MKKNSKLLKKLKKTIELREHLRNVLKQTQPDEITGKENREKQFEPLTQRLEKVEKADKTN